MKINVSLKLARIFILTLLWILALSLYGQEGNIRGTVRDKNKEVLIGVTIKVKGTIMGTVSDIDGKYLLSNVSPDATLEVSYVGMKSQEIDVKKREIINIVLEEHSEFLDEIVIVGYGQQKKASVTGAISAIQTKEIKQSPAANLSVTLAGRMPGLTAVQRSGEPGRDITGLYLRGLGTVNGQAPIILVDGVERSLTYIDPNEVESISILKDVSATAIFGVRGANGVILITTKRGESEVPEINFTSELGVQNFTRFIEPVNSYEHGILKNTALRNDGLEPRYTAEEIQKFKDGSDPLRYPDTDWKSILINDYSLQQRYNLNVSGKGKNMTYFINAGYLNQGGQFKVEPNLKYDPQFKLDRYNFRSNIDVNLGSYLKAYLNLGGYLEDQNMPMGVMADLSTDHTGTLSSTSAARNIIAYMFDLPPTIPGPTSPDGSVTTTSTWPFPSYGQINRSGFIQQKRVNIMGTYGMELSLERFVKGLNLKGAMSFDVNVTNNRFAHRTYEKKYLVIDRSSQDENGDDNAYYRPFNDDINSPLQIWGSYSFSQLRNMQTSLNYERSFNEHSITGLLLFQQQSRIIGQELPYNLNGLASRITYGYDNKYYLEFNAGYNGSEQFAKGQRYGFFPAISGAWNLTNEPFFHNQNIFTSLKLRGSYGLVGNDRIGGTRFLYLDDIQIAGGAWASSLGKGQHVQINLLKSTNLKWEVAKKNNLGLEMSFLDHSLQFNLDVFRETRDNVLRRRGRIPIMNGLPSNVLPPINIGVIENKGYEIEIEYKKSINKDLFFLTKLNVSYARNKQIYADETPLTDDYAYKFRETGYRIGQHFGLVTDEYFNTEEELANAPIYNFGRKGPQLGDLKYKDLNNDGLIDEKDMAPIGYSIIPEYTFGNAYSINYKSFDASILLQGVTNVTTRLHDRGTYSDFYYTKRHLESWTKERFENANRISYPRLTTLDSPNEIPNDFFIVDASYIRVKSVEIGFTIKNPRLLNQIGTKSIRFYTNGLNLFTWDRLPTKDFDPELVDAFAYPITRIYNFGINIIF